METYFPFPLTLPVFLCNSIYSTFLCSTGRKKKSVSNVTIPLCSRMYENHWESHSVAHSFLLSFLYSFLFFYNDIFGTKVTKEFLLKKNSSKA